MSIMTTSFGLTYGSIVAYLPLVEVLAQLEHLVLGHEPVLVHVKHLEGSLRRLRVRPLRRFIQELILTDESAAQDYLI